MSAEPERPPAETCHAHAPGGLASSSHENPPRPAAAPETRTLASLPVGARLVLRCRADWRDAAVALVEPDRVVLSVGSPSGRTYRVRRPSASVLSLDGPVPVLGEGSWQAGRVRYDARW